MSTEKLNEAEKLNDLGDLDTLGRVKIPFRFEGQDYVLEEASAGAVERYKAALYKDAKLVDGKPHVSAANLVNRELQLLADCITEKAKGNGSDKYLSTATVKAWPNRIAERLMDKLKSISIGLVEASEEEATEKAISTLQENLANIRRAKGAEGSAKNEPGATSDG
jgi:hypothetical protein